MSEAKKSCAEKDDYEVDMRSDSESSSDSDEDPTEKKYKGNEEIQVEFEGRSPIDTDIDGIKQLLHQLFLQANINTSQLAEEIVGQNYVGSVVTQSEADDDDDDEDDDIYEANMVFGITTALNITKKKVIPCIQQLRAHMLERVDKNANSDIKKVFHDCIEDDANQVGFLLNERFINIPPQISLPLLENLYRDLKRANRKEMDYNFKYYVMFVKFYRKKQTKNEPEEDIFSNAEEEVICREAHSCFEYSVQSETDTGLGGDWLGEEDSSLIPFRKLLLFEADKLPDVILAIREFISE